MPDKPARRRPRRHTPADVAAPDHRGPGRPPGTANSPHTVVDLIPPACPRPECGATLYRIIRIIRVRAITGRAPNGQQRTHITWRRVQCTVCQRYFITAEHSTRPEA